MAVFSPDQIFEDSLQDISIMPEKPYVLHFISNTHWDREWLTNFQETRIMLVSMMDRLLDIFDRYPDYRAFLLDSQAVPVEDYLEIRPENRDRLEKHVRDGRLCIGPWYTDPEGFSVNGESLVRNLLMGHRVAEAYGGVMKAGHTPFGYGQNSQMPQIYKGFGIENMLFYHGVSHEEVANEFIYEGADGTRILGSQMSSFARYNAYHHLYGDLIDDRTYAWERGGLPFRLCRGEPAMRQHIRLAVEKGWDENLLRDQLVMLREREIAVSATRHLAFMLGHDSSEPDEKEREIIEFARQLFPDDEVKHSTLPELMAAIMEEADYNSLSVLKGERRTPKPMPLIMHLYSDVLSSRPRMKQRNTHAEYLLQRRAEPFAVLAALCGAEYPRRLFDNAWKTLLKCHAHDSIAGSGVDDIERDMMYRLRQVIHTGDAVTRESIAALQQRIDSSAAQESDLLLTVYNALPQKRSEIATALIEVPAGFCERGEFSLEALDNGEAAGVQVRTRRPSHAVVNHAGDAPAGMRAEKYEVHFEAKDIPALGYRTWRILRNGAFRRGNGMLIAPDTMENECLRVHINSDGTLRITHKATGEVFDDLHYFLDNAEAGHAWMHHDPAVDAVIDSRGFPVRITREEDGPLLCRFRVAIAMEIPARLEENGGEAWQRLDGLSNASSRSEEAVPFHIVSEITLRKGARYVEISTSFDNTATCHRLRAVFPSRRKGTVCHAESAFDVVERETVFGPDSPWHGTPHVTFPQQRFVDLADECAGLAIINDGSREYEIGQDEERAIYLTLLRAFQVSLCPVSKRWEELPEMELAQSPGKHRFRYRIFPHAGDYAAGGVLPEADRQMTPLETAQAGRNSKGNLPPCLGFLQVAPEKLCMSALKAAEEGAGVILRLFNPTQATLEGRITVMAPITAAAEVTLEEHPEKTLQPEGNRLHIRVPPKKIVTLCLEIEER
jgi:mannosylglycerate hydrolase